MKSARAREPRKLIRVEMIVADDERELFAARGAYAERLQNERMNLRARAADGDEARGRGRKSLNRHAFQIARLFEENMRRRYTRRLIF